MIERDSTAYWIKVPDSMFDDSPISSRYGVSSGADCAVSLWRSICSSSLTIQLMCPLILIKGFGDLFCYQLVYSTKSEKIILPAAASASIINIITNAALIPSLLQMCSVASVISEFVTNANSVYLHEEKSEVQMSIGNHS